MVDGGEEEAGGVGREDGGGWQIRAPTARFVKEGLRVRYWTRGMAWFLREGGMWIWIGVCDGCSCAAVVDAMLWVL